MKLSVIVITKNEQEMIGDCLESVQWADEIVLVDSGSTDKTLAIAKKYGARIINLTSTKMEFNKWRNVGLKTAVGDWVFYLDADERTTPELRKEIQKLISAGKTDRRGMECAAYEIPRKNFYFGKEMKHGGAWPDYVRRLFLRKNLELWRGDLHEFPEIKGKWGKLKSPMIHLTHRDLSSMVEKTANWTKIEAELLYKANHPPVVWWRILRMMASKFFERIIRQGGWRDGVEGWINGIFETFNTFIIYARLWEMQCQGKVEKKINQE